MASLLLQCTKFDTYMKNDETIDKFQMTINAASSTNTISLSLYKTLSSKFPQFFSEDYEVATALRRDSQRLKAVDISNLSIVSSTKKEFTLETQKFLIVEEDETFISLGFQSFSDEVFEELILLTEQ